MSVAFRRDCDEEHLEPHFELPIPPGPNLVTPRIAQVAELEAGLSTDLRTRSVRHCCATPAIDEAG